MAESQEDFTVRMRELDIREKELKNERVLGIVKVLTTGVVVTLIPAILTSLIQQQELELQTLKGEIDYLNQFSSKVVERDDLTKRRNFVQYLATVAHSKESRGRWEKYFTIVDEAAKQQEKLDQDLSRKNAAAREEEQKVAALQEQLKLAIESKSEDLENIKNQLSTARENLQSLDQAILEKSAERDALIESAKLSTDTPNRSNEVAELVSGMNSEQRSVRLLSVNKLIEKHRANAVAVNLSLNSLTPPLLDDLSPSGRINVMVFLRNTASTAWTLEDVHRGRESVQLMRERHDQGIGEIGPQTEDIIQSFTAFLDHTEKKI